MKKVTKQSKRRLIWFGGLSLFAIVCFIYTFISYIVEINSLEKQAKELEQKLISLQELNSNLKVEIDKLKDPDYLARYARENFLYTKDGEYVIRIDENDNVVVDINTEKLENYEIVLVALGSSIFILGIYIFIKIKKQKNKKQKKLH